MNQRIVSTDRLSQENIVKDRSGRVLIVRTVNSFTIPGTDQSGFLVILEDPRSGKSVQHVTSTQTRWIILC